MEFHLNFMARVAIPNMYVNAIWFETHGKYLSTFRIKNAKAGMLEEFVAVIFKLSLYWLCKKEWHWKRVTIYIYCMLDIFLTTVYTSSALAAFMTLK